MNNTKKTLIFAGIGIDVAATIFFFVISIIMIVKTSAHTYDDPTNLIGYLQANPTVYLVGFVIPLFVLLAINIILLVYYVKSSSKRRPVEVNELSQDQLDALKKELLNDLAKEDKKDKEEDKK